MCGVDQDCVKKYTKAYEIYAIQAQKKKAKSQTRLFGKDAN